MKKSTFLKLLSSLLAVFTLTVFTSCVDDNEDLGAPSLTVTPSVLSFDASGNPIGASEFVVESNRDWSLEIKAEDTWVRPSATSGSGNGKVSFNIFADNVGHKATLNFVLKNKYGVYKSVPVTITQGEIKPETLIYTETFGASGPTQSPYPFLDQYTDYVKSGEGIENVNYTGSTGMSARQSGKLSEGYVYASGLTKAFFGSNSMLLINKIALKSDQTDLKLGFGGTYYNGTTQDGEFKPEKFHAYISADGATWVELTYTTVKAGEFWVYGTANFSLKNPVSELYIKYMVDEASVFAIDDPRLSTGPGGQEIDLPVGGVTVTTDTPTAITATGATFSGAVSSTEGVTEVGFQYIANAADINWETATKVAADAVAAAFNKAVTGLTTGTTYAVRAYAVTADGEKVGTVKTFTPQAAPSGDQIVVDFTGDAAVFPADFPTSKGTNGPNTYQFGTGYDFTLLGTMNGSNVQGYYKAYIYENSVKTDKTYLLIGSQGAYIELPAKATKALTKVVCTTTNAGGAVDVAITDATNAPVAGGAVQTWVAQTLASYTYTLSGTAENVKYRIYINNAKNAQLTKLELTYGSSTPAGPSVEVNPSSLSFTADADNAGKTIAVTTTNQGANSLFAESSDPTNFPVTLVGTTVTVKATENTTTQARSATVKVYLAATIAGERVAEQSVAVSQVGKVNPPTPGATVLTFSNKADITPDMPIGPDGATERAAFTLNGVTFYLAAATGGKYQWQDNSSYQGAVAPFTGIYIKNGYMELPAVANKKLTAVTLTSTGGMGKGVTAGIYDTNDQVVVAAESFTKEAPLTLGLDGTANTAYRIKIVAGNAQIHQLEAVYTSVGGATPNITGVDPTSLTWEATATAAKTIAVSGTDIDGKLTVSSLTAFNVSVSGTTVTVTPKAANTGTADIAEELTISATGGNSKTVALTHSKPAAAVAPNITGVDPTSLTWEATATAAKTIAVSGTDIDGKLTVSSLTDFNVSVSGTTVTVTPKAANTGTADIAETLTISATGGNSKTVALTHSKPASGGDTFTKITSVANLAAGTYMLGGVGTTTKAALHLVSSATAVTSGNCYTAEYTFNESTGELTTSGKFPAVEITLEAVAGTPNAYKIKFAGGYLTATSASSGKLKMEQTTDLYWTFSDNDSDLKAVQSGSVAALLVASTSASSNIIRSWGTTAGPNGLIFFKKN